MNVVNQESNSSKVVEKESNNIPAVPIIDKPENIIKSDYKLNQKNISTTRDDSQPQANALVNEQNSSSLSESSVLSESSNEEDNMINRKLNSDHNLSSNASKNNKEIYGRKDNSYLKSIDHQSKSITSNTTTSSNPYNKVKKPYNDNIDEKRPSRNSILEKQTSSKRTSHGRRYYISVNNLHLNFSKDWLKRILIDRLGQNSIIKSIVKYTRRDACIVLTSQRVQERALRQLNGLRLNGRTIIARLVTSPRKIFERFGIFENLMEELSDESMDRQSYDSRSNRSSYDDYNSRGARRSDYNSYSSHSFSSQRSYSSSDSRSRSRGHISDDRKSRISLKKLDRNRRNRSITKSPSSYSSSYLSSASSGHHSTASSRSSPIYENKPDKDKKTPCNADKDNKNKTSSNQNLFDDSDVDPIKQENKKANQEKSDHLDKPDTDPDIFANKPFAKDKIFKIAINPTTIVQQNNIANDSDVIKMETDQNTAKPLIQSNSPIISADQNLNQIVNDVKNGNQEKKESLIKKELFNELPMKIGMLENMKSNNDKKNNNKLMENQSNAGPNDLLESISPKHKKNGLSSNFNDTKPDPTSMNDISNKEIPKIDKPEVYDSEVMESLSDSSSNTSCSLSSESSCDVSKSPKHSPYKSRVKTNNYDYVKRQKNIIQNSKTYNILDGETEHSENFIKRDFNSKKSNDSSSSYHSFESINNKRQITQERDDITDQKHDKKQNKFEESHMSQSDISFLILTLHKLQEILNDDRLNKIMAIDSNYLSKPKISSPSAQEIDFDYSKLEHNSRAKTKKLIEGSEKHDQSLERIRMVTINGSHAKAKNNKDNSNRNDSNNVEDSPHNHCPSKSDYKDDDDNDNKNSIDVHEDEGGILESCSQSPSDDYNESHRERNSDGDDEPIKDRKSRMKDQRKFDECNEDLESSHYGSGRSKKHYKKDQILYKQKTISKSKQKSYRHKRGNKNEGISDEQQISMKIRPMKKSIRSKNSKYNESRSSEDSHSSYSFDNDTHHEMNIKTPKLSTEQLKELLKFYERSKRTFSSRSKDSERKTTKKKYKVSKSKQHQEKDKHSILKNRTSKFSKNKRRTIRNDDMEYKDLNLDESNQSRSSLEKSKKFKYDDKVKSTNKKIGNVNK